MPGIGAERRPTTCCRVEFDRRLDRSHCEFFFLKANFQEWVFQQVISLLRKGQDSEAAQEIASVPQNDRLATALIVRGLFVLKGGTLYIS